MARSMQDHAGAVRGLARMVVDRGAGFFIEFHGPVCPAMAEMRTSAGYIFRHIGSAAAVPGEKLTEVAGGHLYCVKMCKKKRK